MPPDEIVDVTAIVSGISRGTESLVFAGKVPQSEWSRMRAPFQEGDFPFPVKYGYAMVGRSDDGARVFCLHPHQDRFRVPSEAALPVPDDVSDRRAVLAPQMETALNATWDACTRVGDRIAVIGAGVIGCLIAYLCARVPGAEVTLVDIDPERRAVAEALGVAFALTGDALPADCDVVFHASATAAGLSTALACAGFEATLVELSWYGDRPVAVDLGGAFHSLRLRLLSSQVGAVAPDRRARWSHRRRLALALAFCADPVLDRLVQDETPFADLPARLPDILGRPGALCHLVRY
jgi:threonine dehydrogenase-like Zn-dependent dehydrogenase